MMARLDVTITDEPPLAQAVVIITAEPPADHGPLAEVLPERGPRVATLTCGAALGLIAPSLTAAKAMKSNPPQDAAKKSSGGILETFKTIIYAILIALVVRTVAYEPFNIPSGSMVPTLLVGDYLFVSKFSYGYSRFSLPFGLPLFSGRILDVSSRPSAATSLCSNCRPIPRPTTSSGSSACPATISR